MVFLPGGPAQRSRGEACYGRDAVIDLSLERGSRRSRPTMALSARAEFEAHEARVCIQTGRCLACRAKTRTALFRRAEYGNRRRRWPSFLRMRQNCLIKVEVAKRCSSGEIRLGASMLRPIRCLPTAITEDFLRRVSARGRGGFRGVETERTGGIAGPSLRRCVRLKPPPLGLRGPHGSERSAFI